MANDEWGYAILNDGWRAYEGGRFESDCPYPDDPEAAQLWIRGWRNADWYHNRKDDVKRKWLNRD